MRGMRTATDRKRDLCGTLLRYCFKYDTAELVHKMKVAEKELIGLSHHPHKNLLATYAEDGTVQLWKP
jgi:WD40 repeat-containing protein SMU1